MFCEESLGKIKFRAFPKRVGPRILLLQSVDYFGASENYGVDDSAMIEIRCHVNHFFDSGNYVISLESRPLNLRVYVHVRV